MGDFFVTLPFRVAVEQGAMYLPWASRLGPYVKKTYGDDPKPNSKKDSGAAAAAEVTTRSDSDIGFDFKAGASQISIPSVIAALDQMTELRKKLAKVCCRGGSEKDVLSDSFVEGTAKQYLRLVGYALAHLPLSATSETDELVTKCNKYASVLVPRGNLFAAGSVWDDSVSAVSQSNNASTEVATCLFAIASSWSASGAREAGCGSVEGAKSGFRYYQQAAGVYVLLAGSISQRMSPSESQVDLGLGSLQLLQSLALAQAHHCGYAKAAVEMKDKHALLSKIAADGAALYSALATGFAGVANAASATIPKGAPRGAKTNYAKYCAVAAGIFTARAHAHLADELLAAEKCGEALGRLRACGEALQAVHTQAKDTKDLLAWWSEVDESTGRVHLATTQKNDTVYFDKVPKSMPAPEPLRKPLGKPLPMDSLLDLPGLTTVVPAASDEAAADGAVTADPFRGILPVHLVAAVSAWRNVMSNQLGMSAAAVKEHRKRVRSALTDLGVAAAIETATRGDDASKGRIPETLRKRIIALRTPSTGSKNKKQGAGQPVSLMSALIGSLQVSANMAAAAEQHVGSIEETIAAEDAEDKAFAARYTDAIWYAMRQPSHRLPDVVALRTICVDMRSAIKTGVTLPLEALKSEVDASLRELSRLDWPLEDLDALMPYTQSRQAKTFSQEIVIAVESLRGVLGRVDALEAQERDLLQAMRAHVASDDVTVALAVVATERRESVFAARSTQLEAMAQRMIELMRAGDELLAEAQGLMMTLAQVRSTDPVADDAQRVSCGLERSCDLLERLMADVGDVIAVASGLVDRGESNLGLARSVATGRAVEAVDFVASLDRKIAEVVNEAAARRMAASDQRGAPAGAGPTGAAPGSRQAQLEQQVRELEQQQAARVAARAAHAGQQQQQQQTTVAAPPRPPNLVDQYTASVQQNTLDATFGALGVAPATTPYQYSSPGPPQYSPPRAGAPATAPTFAPNGQHYLPPSAVPTQAQPFWSPPVAQQPPPPAPSQQYTYAPQYGVPGNFAPPPPPSAPPAAYHVGFGPPQ